MELKYVDEVLKLLATFGGADEFTELVNSETSKEVKTMCQAIDRIKEQRIEKEIFQIIANALKQGHTLEQVAAFNGVSLDEVLEVQASLDEGQGI